MIVNLALFPGVSQPQTSGTSIETKTRADMEPLGGGWDPVVDVLLHTDSPSSIAKMNTDVLLT